MTVSTPGPVHTKAHWAKPQAYAASMAEPKRFPRPVILRSTCGHVLGVGIVGRRQRYLTWRSCR